MSNQLAPKAASELNSIARPRPKPGRMKFTLAEKLVILSLDDDLGTIEPSVKSVLCYTLAAAILSELTLARKIRCGDAGEANEGRLLVGNPTPTGSEILDAAIAAIAAEEKPRKLGRWIETLAQKQTLRQVATRLEERGVIRIEEKSLFWLLPYNIHPQRDATAKYWIKRRLRALALAGGKITSADATLLSLLKASRLLKLVFTRDERRAAGKIVDALAQSQPLDAPVAQLLADIASSTSAAAAIAVAAG